MEDLLKKEPVKRVQTFIKKFDSKLKILVLESTARTAKDAAYSLKCEVGAIVKSLLLKANGGFILCLVSGDKRCSLNKIKKITQMKDVSMADADQVKNHTGFTIGGVSPVGHLNKSKVLVDLSLSRYEHLYAAAGHPNSIFKINYKKLIEITKGKEEDIV